MTQAETVLRYWFGDGAEDRRQWWFAGGPALDEEMRARFGDTVGAALRGELDEWREDPQGRLALVLLLDQFTRQIHRGTPRAFAGDPAAQRHAQKAVAAGEDRTFGTFQRAFLYMPFMHAEDLHLQRRGVMLYDRLHNDVDIRDREAVRGFLEHAVDHARIVQRFGRFPDRNVLLGRDSTREEQRFLVEEPRPWFENQTLHSRTR